MRKWGISFELPARSQGLTLESLLLCILGAVVGGGPRGKCVWDSLLTIHVDYDGHESI